MSAHAARRVAIVAAHPRIKDLEGVEWRSKYIGVALVALHGATGVYAATCLAGWQQLLFAYAVGATCVQALFLAIHECSHNLFFASSERNMRFAILVLNVPILVPFAAAFRSYHLAHHRHQGVPGHDTDLPSAWERRHVVGPARKLAWLSNQIVAYALRPVCTRSMGLTADHALNAAWQLAAVATLVRFGGWECVRYFAGCVWLAGGLHPCAGHFLSEHYTKTPDAQDTFSYYGPLNALTWNVGFHNEHHDFPRVPWSRLPAVRRAAPEFYDGLAQVSSWPALLVAFVCDPGWGLECRARAR